MSQMMPTVSRKTFLFAKDMPKAHSSLHLSRAETPKGRSEPAVGEAPDTGVKNSHPGARYSLHDSLGLAGYVNEKG